MRGFRGNRQPVSSLPVKVGAENAEHSLRASYVETIYHGANAMLVFSLGSGEQVRAGMVPGDLTPGKAD
jgi:hypothetical protein